MEADDDYVPMWKPPRRTDKTRPAHSPKKEAPKAEPAKSKPADDDIAELVKGLERLQISEPEYRSLYTRLYYLSPASCRWYAEPAVPNSPTFPVQRPRFDPADRNRRDPPPHLPVFPEPRPSDRSLGMSCFGCGSPNHRMGQCDKIETLVVQGRVRRINGRLRWPDGSNIYREPEETWFDAIQRRMKHEEKAKDADKGSRDKGVYYLDIAREESDADTEDQETLGWRSGVAPINNLQASGVDRPPRVSRETRKAAQTNSLAGTHRVKEFPARRNADGQIWKRNPVSSNVDVDRGNHRPRTPTISTPVDVTPKEMKDERNTELIPMDVDEPLVEKGLHDRRKIPTHERKDALRDVAHVGTKKEKMQSNIVNEVLNSQLTIRVQELVSLSPSLRRDLLKSLRTIRGEEVEDAETSRPEGPKVAWKEDGKRKEVMRVETRMAGEDGIRVERSSDAARLLEKRRRALVRLKGTIGNLQIKGIVDSGASANIISAAAAEATGLPIVPLRDEAFPVTGISGPSIKCKYWIPNVTMFLTEGKLPTRSDLFVVEGVKAHLLFGRPWMVDNLGGIQEKETGTYVSWSSEGVPYELNTTKAEEWEDENGEKVDLYEAREDTLRAVTAMVVKRGKSPDTDLSYVPDSEENRSPPAIESPPVESEDSEEVREAEKWARERVAEWKKEWETAEKDEVGDVEITPPPPNQLGRRRPRESVGDDEEIVQKSRKRRKVAKQGKEIIEVDEEMVEEFAQLVQEDVDEEEWKAFCAREKRRRANKDSHWLAWIEEEGSGNAPPQTSSVPSQDDLNNPEGPDEPESEHQDPPEPSQTLRTPPGKSPEPVKAQGETPVASSSTETVARRSQRVRWLTEKGLYDERMKMKRRTYQRKETATRTISKKTQDAKDDSEPQIDDEEEQIFCFCLQLGEGDEEDMLSSNHGRYSSRSGEERVNELRNEGDDRETYESPPTEVDNPQSIQARTQSQWHGVEGPSETYGSVSRDSAKIEEVGQEQNASEPRPPSLTSHRSHPEGASPSEADAASGDDKSQAGDELIEDLSVEEATNGVVSPGGNGGEMETTLRNNELLPDTPSNTSTNPYWSDEASQSPHNEPPDERQIPNETAENHLEDISPALTTSDVTTSIQSPSINEPNGHPLEASEPLPYSTDSEDDRETPSIDQTPSSGEVSQTPDSSPDEPEQEEAGQPRVRRTRAHPNLRMVSMGVSNGSCQAFPGGSNHESATDHDGSNSNSEDNPRPVNGQPMNEFQGDSKELGARRICCRKVTQIGQGSEPIKARRKTRQTTYLARWLPSLFRPRRRAKLAHRAILLLLFLLIVALVSQPPNQTSQSTTYHHMIIKNAPPDAGPLSSTRAPQ